MNQAAGKLRTAPNMSALWTRGIGKFSSGGYRATRFECRLPAELWWEQQRAERC